MELWHAADANALITVGITEFWAALLDQGERHPPRTGADSAWRRSPAPGGTRAGPSQHSPESGDWLLTLPGPTLAVRTQQDKEGHHQPRHRQGTGRRAPSRTMHDRHLTGRYHSPRPRRYEIRVRGRLGETIRSAFPALQARARGDDTVLTGVLADQAALYGVLTECEALGLELLEVRSLDQQDDHHQPARSSQ
jgi:hypothetical protein